MPIIPNVSPDNVRGLADKVIGVFEELFGTVVGNEDLTKRGQLHQEAGTKRLEALQHQASATKEDLKATTAEQGERAAQASKEDV